MREPAALQAALVLAKRPAQARGARRLPLPRGMTFLLEVASGDEGALSAAREMTQRTDGVLRDAAGFFIEQVLLTGSPDSYRVLGGRADDARATLRRHMVLLMKWLHPDAAAQHGTAADVDRSVFANRIAQAWDNLKTTERRDAYNRKLEREKLGHDRASSAAPSLKRRTGKGELQTINKGKPRARPPLQMKRRPVPGSKPSSFLLDQFARFFGRPR